MKKTMLKILCALMAVAMMLTMGGCASDEEQIIGTWESEIDCADWFMDKLTEGMGTSDTAKELAKYLKIASFKMTLFMTFNQDGTYSMGIREDSIRAAMEGVKEDIKKGFEGYLGDMLEKMLGETVSADQLKELVDASMEKAFSEDTMNQLTQSVQKSTTEGRYKLEDGKIYVSKDVDTEPDKDYDTYKLSGNKLTLQECFCEAENEDTMKWIKEELYPLQFKKVS